MRDGSEQASLKFLHTSYGVNCSLILQMKMASLCTEPSNEDVRLVVQRLIVLPSRGRVVDDLPLDTSISELLNPLMNA